MPEKWDCWRVGKGLEGKAIADWCLRWQDGEYCVIISKCKLQIIHHHHKYFELVRHWLFPNDFTVLIFFHLRSLSDLKRDMVGSLLSSCWKLGLSTDSISLMFLAANELLRLRWALFKEPDFRLLLLVWGVFKDCPVSLLVIQSP